MNEHRKDIKLYLEAAERHSDNPLITQELERFWASYDKLVAATKLVDNGEIKEIVEANDTNRWRKQWEETFKALNTSPWVSQAYQHRILGLNTSPSTIILDELDDGK